MRADFRALFQDADRNFLIGIELLEPDRRCQAAGPPPTITTS
jgi:phytoene/squalene synthetase